MKNVIKIKSLKITKQLIGKKLPTNIDGHAGRAAENLLESYGIPINRGHGTDIDLGLEVKTRKLTATSAQTICVMQPKDVIKYSYYDSTVYTKFQQQLRIKTDENDIIVSAEIYDFDQPHIQSLIESAYEHGRMQLTKNPELLYTPYTGFWGYFENTNPSKTTSLDFRISDTDMQKLESMSKSTFNQLFTEL
jgi:hypothetical protein